MKKQSSKSKKGFTIIEVVLVLAIAGLIFLMVFVALPALQRSQKDTQRRDDMSRFMSQLSQRQTNNKGNVPGNTTGDWENFIDEYLEVGGDTFADPDGTNYTIGDVCVANGSGCSSGNTMPDASLTWEANQHQIYVYKNARCDGESAVFVANSPRQVAIRYKLEGAGVACFSN